MPALGGDAGEKAAETAEKGTDRAMKTAAKGGAVRTGNGLWTVMAYKWDDFDRQKRRRPEENVWKSFHNSLIILLSKIMEKAR
jgi:hypothetical protein